MNKAITYKINTYNDDGIRTGTESSSYTPTLADAKAWDATTEKYTFVLDMLGTSCTMTVEAVEDAYDNLLGR